MTTSKDCEIRISREDWIAKAARVYRACGDGPVADKLARILAVEQDWSPTESELDDPYEAALADIEGRRCACGVKSALDCEEEWGPTCDLGNNPEHARAVPESMVSKAWQRFEKAVQLKEPDSKDPT